MVEDQNKDVGLESNKGVIMGKEIAEWLSNEENQEMIIDGLVKNTDIPILTEKTEKVVYSAIVMTIAQIMEKAFSK